jgi:hypothetical protein
MPGARRFERIHGAFGLYVRSNGNAAVQRPVNRYAQRPEGWQEGKSCLSKLI